MSNNIKLIVSGASLRKDWLCKNCPNLSSKSSYSADGWRMEDWFCDITKKAIRYDVEPYEEDETFAPDWCPLDKKEEKESV